MTVAEAQEYFDKLTPAQAQRYNLLVETYLKLGKPIEGAYQAAKTVMEEEDEPSSDNSGSDTSDASR